MATSKIPVTHVESHQISDIGYDPTSCTLCVFFNQKGGRSKPYHYSPFTPEQWAEFQVAPSKGSWFGKNVKGARGEPPIIPFAKIIETDEERAERKRLEAQPA
jgi:hypothetical protein